MAMLMVALAAALAIVALALYRGHRWREEERLARAHADAAAAHASRSEGNVRALLHHAVREIDHNLAMAAAELAEANEERLEVVQAISNKVNERAVRKHEIETLVDAARSLPAGDERRELYLREAGDLAIRVREIDEWLDDAYDERLPWAEARYDRVVRRIRLGLDKCRDLHLSAVEAHVELDTSAIARRCDEIVLAIHPGRGKAATDGQLDAALSAAESEFQSARIEAEETTQPMKHRDEILAEVDADLRRARGRQALTELLGEKLMAELARSGSATVH